MKPVVITTPKAAGVLVGDTLLVSRNGRLFVHDGGYPWPATPAPPPQEAPMSSKSPRSRPSAKTTDPRRLKLTKALQAAARSKGLISGADRSLYDNVLDEVTGKRRTRDLTLPEMGRVLDRINGKLPADPTARATSPAAAKVDVLATVEKLRQVLGVDTAYLDGMAQRMFGRARLEFLTPSETHRLSIALRYAINRKQQPAPAASPAPAGDEEFIEQPWEGMP